MTREDKIKRAAEVRDLIGRAKARAWDLEMAISKDDGDYTCEAIRKALDGLEYMAHILVKEQAATPPAPGLFATSRMA